MRWLTVLMTVLAASAAACTAAPIDQASPTPAASLAPSSSDTVAPSRPSDAPVALPSNNVEAAPPVIGPFAAEQPEVLEGAAVRFQPVWDPAGSPAEIVERIERTEEQVRDDTLAADVRAAAATEGQLVYRQLARTAAWQDEVLSTVDARWVAITRGNLDAADALARLRATAEPPTSLPSWEVVPPAPADELLQHYKDAAADQGIEWVHLAAINLVETRMGRIRGLSTAGARGPMQFIPASWEIFGNGGDIDDERDAIFAAARHLKVRGGDPYDSDTALFRYNNSEHYVAAVQAYANVLRDDPSAYAAYHGWQVFYVTPEEDFLLPVGYREPERVAIAEYLGRPVLRVAG